MALRKTSRVKESPRFGSQERTPTSEADIPMISLAHVPLYWMIKQAQLCGLQFKQDPDAITAIKVGQDRDGRLYDSRSGMGGYYRYGPRKIRALSNMDFSLTSGNSVRVATPKIHDSAFERMRNGASPYAPIGLPQRFAIVDDDGRIVPSSTVEPSVDADTRGHEQERVWNLVWYRRIVYFATVAASLHLLLFPLIYGANRINELSSAWRPISELLRLAGTFLPGIAGWWINSFSSYPGWFVGSAIFVVLLTGLGTKVGAAIVGRMHCIWKRAVPPPRLVGRVSDCALYYYRRCFLRRFILIGMKRYLLPIGWAGLLLYFGAALTSHMAFNFWDASGFFCEFSCETKGSRA